MKAKIIDLLNTEKLWGELLEGKLNGAVSLKIAEIAQEIGYKLKTFEESRTKLITDAGGKYNEEKKKMLFESEDEEKRVNEEFQEMVDAEVELHCRKLNEKDLEKLDIEPGKILGIMWAIEKDKE